MSKQLPTFMAEDEPERLIGASTRERDRLVCLVMLTMGLRVGEVHKLRIEHLDFRKRLLWVRLGKGGRDRCIPIPRVMVGPLRGWCAGRKSGPVFLSRQGGPLAIRTIQLLVKALAVKAGLPRAQEARAISPHKFRHSFATRTLEAGAAIHEVQRLLGHQNVQVTSNYLHCLSDDRLREAVDRVY